MAGILFATQDPSMGGQDGRTSGNFIKEEYERGISPEAHISTYSLIFFCLYFVVVWNREYLIIKEKRLLKYRLPAFIKRFIIFAAKRPFSLF